MYIWNTFLRYGTDLIHVTKNKVLLIGGYHEILNFDAITFFDIVLYEYNTCTLICGYPKDIFPNFYNISLVVKDTVWIFSRSYKLNKWELYILNLKNYKFIKQNTTGDIPNVTDLQKYNVQRRRYYPKRNLIYIYSSYDKEWTINTLTFVWNKLPLNNKKFNWKKFDFENECEDETCICNLIAYNSHNLKANL